MKHKEGLGHKVNGEQKNKRYFLKDFFSPKLYIIYEQSVAYLKKYIFKSFIINFMKKHWKNIEK